MHNVRVEQLESTMTAAQDDPSAARVDVDLSGTWRPAAEQVQFGGVVTYPQGETVLEADFPPFLGGQGRAPSPLAYCFYGAMCCYGATYALQAALAGVELRSLTIRLRLTVDFRTALGLGEFPPLEEFRFEVEVTTDASDEDIQRIKALADERCPAIWAMQNKVPHRTAARRA